MAIYKLDKGYAIDSDEKREPCVDLIGQSSDAKPTNVGAGSTFIEGDTQTVYIFDGAAWRAF